MVMLSLFFGAFTLMFYLFYYMMVFAGYCMMFVFYAGALLLKLIFTLLGWFFGWLEEKLA